MLKSKQTEHRSIVPARRGFIGNPSSAFCLCLSEPAPIHRGCAGNPSGLSPVFWSSLKPPILPSIPIPPLYTCRGSSTNETFCAKQSQSPQAQNQRNLLCHTALHQYLAPPESKKRTVRQAKLVQFSRFNPARSKVSLPAGMNMYA